MVFVSLLHLDQILDTILPKELGWLYPHIVYMRHLENMVHYTIIKMNISIFKLFYMSFNFLKYFMIWSARANHIMKYSPLEQTIL